MFLPGLRFSWSMLTLNCLLAHGGRIAGGARLVADDGMVSAFRRSPDSFRRTASEGA